MVKDLAQELVKELKHDNPKVSKSCSAVVSRVDADGTVWVRVAGSEKETPTASTSAEVKRGDSVTVEWRNNKLYVAGNYTDPSAGTTRVAAVEDSAARANDAAMRAVNDANIAKTAAEQAIADAATAQTAAGEAQSAASAAQTAASSAQSQASAAATAASNAQTSANNASEYASRALGNLSTVQNVTETLNWITQHGTMTLTTDTALDPSHVYFVADPNGDYVVGNVHYSVVSEPRLADVSTYYELSINESLNNYVATHLAVDSEGLWILPDSGGVKILIATGGTGHTYDAGTYIIQGSAVLASFGTETVIKTSDGTELAHFGYDEGQAQSGTAIAPYYSFGIRAVRSVIGNYSVAEGNGTTASNWASHAEGSGTEASEDCAHAEGSRTIASGWASHAEGSWTTASKDSAHAEGGYTTADGARCHAEGSNTTASMFASHAEGSGTKALGHRSHSQNDNTIARGMSQTAIGKYNIAQGTANSIATTDYAFIIGNGTSDTNRSNAFAVDWSGNVDVASGAQYKIGGTALSASDVGAVPTTRKVNNKALSSDISLSASDVEAVPTTRKVNNKALNNDISLSASDVGALPNTTVIPSKTSDLTNDSGFFKRAYAYINEVTATTITAVSTAGRKKVPIENLKERIGFTYDSANKGIIVSESGMYAISITLGVNPATSGDLMGALVYQNSSVLMGPSYKRIGGNYDEIVVSPVIAQLNAGDVLTLYCQNNTSGRGTITAGKLAVWRVG